MKYVKLLLNKEISLTYSESFRSNPDYEEQDLTNFGLPCTLFKNYSASHSVFKIKLLIKNFIKQLDMHL